MPIMTGPWRVTSRSSLHALPPSALSSILQASWPPQLICSVTAFPKHAADYDVEYQQVYRCLPLSGVIQLQANT